MNAPRPLLEDGGTDLERTVLRSGLDEQPPRRLLERTLTTVGVTAGVVTAAATTTGAASAAAVGAKAGAISTAWFVVKCLGIGLGAAALGAGAVRVVTPMETTAGAAHGVERVANVAASAQVAALASPERAAPAADAPGDPAAPSEVPSGADGRPTGAGAGAGAAAGESAAASVAAPEARASTLAGETALIDAARKALNGGDASRALALLDQHGQEFAGGVLAQEAEILRIRALYARGDRATAATRARRFLARNPGSPHAERLRGIADEGARDIP
ncbi:MAG: outer membrane protein assembly factor BamD [Polyangiaceae bacterium]